MNVRVEGSLLSIDAEHLETNQRWSGEYTAQCKRSAPQITLLIDYFALITSLIDYFALITLPIHSFTLLTLLIDSCAHRH